jgi:hypothetical protein
MAPGARPQFGVARPMKGGPEAAKGNSQPLGGEQFPPLPGEDAGPLPPMDGGPGGLKSDAMTRLADRVNGVAEGNYQAEGFEASVHKIKEQVLPRLLERVDPEAAATLTKDELSEEFRPIILEVLAELKVTLNRREQFALEKVLIDELLGFGPLEELLNDPDITDIMVNGPDQTYIEKKGKLVLAPIRFRDESAPVPDRPAHRQSGRPPRRPDHPASRRPSERRQPRQRYRSAARCAAPQSRFVSFPKSRSRSTCCKDFGSMNGQDGDGAQDRGRLPDERRDFGRYGFRQDNYA